jgi:CheY-like chemotaxis protein
MAGASTGGTPGLQRVIASRAAHIRQGKVIVKSTVLLVEDSQVQKLANEEILTRAGYLVLLAGDGEDALRLVREASPDLVLLDMMLPKLSGSEVLQALKRDPATAAVPVIVLSQLPRTNEAKVKAEGAAAYFEKSKLAEGPIGEAQLVAVIEKTLEARRRIPAAQAGAPARSW